MPLWPFESKKKQKIASVIVILIGIILMIGMPTLKFFNMTISGFVAGLILAFIGLLYLLDVQ